MHFAGFPFPVAAQDCGTVMDTLVSSFLTNRQTRSLKLLQEDKTDYKTTSEGGEMGDDSPCYIVRVRPRMISRSHRRVGYADYTVRERSGIYLPEIRFSVPTKYP